MVEMLFFTVPKSNVKIIIHTEFNRFLYENSAEKCEKLNSLLQYNSI